MQALNRGSKMFKQFLTAFFRNLFFCQLQEKKRLERACRIIAEFRDGVNHKASVRGIAVACGTDNIEQIIEKYRYVKYEYLIRQRYLYIVCHAGLIGLPAYYHYYCHYQQEKPVPALYRQLHERGYAYAGSEFFHSSISVSVALNEL